MTKGDHVQLTPYGKGTVGPTVKDRTGVITRILDNLIEIKWDNTQTRQKFHKSFVELVPTTRQS
jgi:hypothetical protein